MCSTFECVPNLGAPPVSCVRKYNCDNIVVRSSQLCAYDIYLINLDFFLNCQYFSATIRRHIFRFTNQIFVHFMCVYMGGLMIPDHDPNTIFWWIILRIYPNRLATKIASSNKSYRARACTKQHPSIFHTHPHSTHMCVRMCVCFVGKQRKVIQLNRATIHTLRHMVIHVVHIRYAGSAYRRWRPLHTG